MIIFDNCIIQAPDGTNLSRCGKKKIKWYLNRNMADLICEDPITIRLKFEPSGRCGIDDPFILEGKPNICVVCGTENNLTKHHIIPYSFIKYMQIEYKADIIRDIFPLCRDCHDNYEEKSQEKRKEIADSLGISMNQSNVEKVRKIKKAMGVAAALLNHESKIPQIRNEELNEFLKNFLNKESITREDLIALRDYEILKSEDYVNFNKYVAENCNDYNEFARDWRTHFVETMQPKHMPYNWKVDRKTEKVWVPNRMRNQEKRIK